MQLVVIRHGETALNKENRLQGSKGPNEGLNETGRAAIVKLRDGLLTTPAAIYASPLERTQETASIINERFNIPIITVPELMERDFGTLSGKLRSELDDKLIQDDLEGKYDYRPYGGESVEDVKARIMRFLETLPLSTDETVLVITHRGVIRVLYDLYPTDGSGDEIVPASKHIFRVTRMPAN